MDKNIQRVIIEIAISIILIASMFAAVYVYGFLNVLPYVAFVCGVVMVIALVNHIRIEDDIRRR